MKLSIISFTEKGIQLSKKLEEQLKEAECELFTKCSVEPLEKYCIQFVTQSIGEWTKEQFLTNHVLIFVGACGIAVRAVAPNITDKLHDNPVLVMDEMGQYVIPILSGHMGGANEIALYIADKMNAEAVITTATDINRKFAVDLFAKKNGFYIVNKDGIAKVSSKVLSGQKLTMSIETGHVEKNCIFPESIQMVEYPPGQYVDIVITSKQQEFDTGILLRPREYIIGMGCRKGKEAELIEDFVKRTLRELSIVSSQIGALASIDLKKEEVGFLAWSRKENIPFITYTAEELSRVEGNFQKSDFVKERVGIDNVCERAALKVCEPDGELVYTKHAENGMTIAIAKRKWSVRFDAT